MAAAIFGGEREPFRVDRQVRKCILVFLEHGDHFMLAEKQKYRITVYPNGRRKFKVRYSALIKVIDAGKRYSQEIFTFDPDFGFKYTGRCVTADGNDGWVFELKLSPKNVASKVSKVKMSSPGASAEVDGRKRTAQQGVHEDRTDAPRRKTTAVLVMDKMDEEDSPDEEPSPPRVALKNVVVSVPVRMQPTKQINVSVPTSRKTIGETSKPGTEPEARDEPKREADGAAAGRARRKTVTGRSGTLAAPRKIEQEDEEKQKSSPVKPARVMSTRPVVLPKGDFVWVPPASQNQAPTRNCIAVPRQAAPVPKKMASRKTMPASDSNDDDDAFDEKTVKIEASQERSKWKASRATSSKGARSSDSGEDKKRDGSSGSQGEETGEAENRRPRRQTAVTSYKELPLNHKLRRRQ